MRRSAWRMRTCNSEAGSAIVSALIVGLIVASVLTMLAGRSLSDSIASAAHIDRAQAASLAEYGVAAATAELNSGLAIELRRSAEAGVRALAVGLPEEGEVGPRSTAAVDVRVEYDGLGGDILIVSRAEVGRHAHTLSARVRSRSSIDYLLLRNFETIDPIIFLRSRSECATRRDDEARASDCVSSALPAGVLDGPVHSNDIMGLSETTTVGSMLSTSHLEVVAGSVAPALLEGSSTDRLAASPFGLHHRSEILLPRTTAAVARDTHVTCRFRGPTLIRFDGLSVRVTSPLSVARTDDAADADAVIGCAGVDRALLVSPTTIVLPQRAVIEVVRDVGSACSEHPLGISEEEDDARDWWCSGGDAFVWGTYLGARTVLAEDDIQLVWDVVPSAAGEAPEYGSNSGRESVLGLVAGDSIVLRRIVGRPVRRVAPYGQNIAFAGDSIAPFGEHPLDAPSADATTWDAPVIVAALVALRGSVGIQNPTIGELHPGPATIEGSVATRFSGLFHWEDRTSTGALRGEMGYSFVLRYDPVLIDAAPPGMPVTDRGAVRVLGLARMG